MGTAATNSASRDVVRGAVSATGPFGCGTAAMKAASLEEDDDGVTTGAAGGEGGATAVGAPEGLVASPLETPAWPVCFCLLSLDSTPFALGGDVSR